MGESNRRRYALCVHAVEGEDVEVRRVYEVVRDELAAKRGHIRVVDESGEDYLYPAELFVILDLPREVERALRQRTTRRTTKHANKALQRTGHARR
jgi:hypothetical protein